MINVDDRLLDELDEYEFYLVMQIARRMRHNKMEAWPALETLARYCKWHPSTVKKHRARLVEKGFVSMEYRSGKTPIYRFLRGGIGVFMGLKNDAGYEEEPTNGGTKFRGGGGTKFGGGIN